MDCEVMTKLQGIEAQARKDCNQESAYELQAIYGQMCLEAQRMQKTHWDRCELCQSAEVGK